MACAPTSIVDSYVAPCFHITSTSTPTTEAQMEKDSMSLHELKTILTQRPYSFTPAQATEIAGEFFPRYANDALKTIERFRDTGWKPDEIVRLVRGEAAARRQGNALTRREHVDFIAFAEQLIDFGFELRFARETVLVHQGVFGQFGFPLENFIALLASFKRAQIGSQPLLALLQTDARAVFVDPETVTRIIKHAGSALSPKRTSHILEELVRAAQARDE